MRLLRSHVVAADADAAAEIDAVLDALAIAAALAP